MASAVPSARLCRRRAEVARLRKERGDLDPLDLRVVGHRVEHRRDAEGRRRAQSGLLDPEQLRASLINSLEPPAYSSDNDDNGRLYDI